MSSTLLKVVAEQLDRIGPAPKVAVVTRRPGHRKVRALAKGLPAADLVELAVTDGMDDLHLRLAAHGPFDLVVDLARAPRRPARRFANLLLHTRPGGVLVVRPPRKGDAAGRRDRQLTDFVDRLVDARQASRGAGTGPAVRSPRGRGRHQQDFDALVLSLQDLSIRRDHVVAVNGVRALAVIPEQGTNALLERREGPDRVLATVPGVTWTVRCTVSSNSEDRLVQLPAGYASPDLSLREYHDVVCLPRQAVLGDNVVLPDSYRHNFRRRPTTRALTEWTPGFVRSPGVPDRILPGSWFHLDSEYRGHFGHALTEQVSRVWGWLPARERDPSTKALVFPHKGRRIAEWEYDLWAAAGIDRSDLVLVDEPTRVEVLVGASPMFAMPGFVHPAIEGTYTRIGSALAASAGSGPWPRRVFVSRRIRKRMCRNTDEVEALFARSGFEVVYPEDHRLADQVELFRRAEVIAGFAGSGMFHIAFTGGPKHVILVCSEGYRAQNEYLMAAVLGHRLTYVVSSLDAEPTGPAKHADFTFVPDREGRFAQEVLDDL